MNDETRNREVMLSVMAAFQEADLQPLFAALHPDVVWCSHAPAAFFRFGGIYHGVAGMKEYTALLFSRYHFLRYAPRAISAAGDRVWGQFDVEARHVPSGRNVTCQVVYAWTMEAGRIKEHHCYFDTADVLMQQGDLQAA